MGDKPTVIVITCSEDGDKLIKEVRVETFLNDLKAGHYGERPVFAKKGEIPDLDYFVGMIVIKGEIVEPKAVQVATEYDL